MVTTNSVLGGVCIGVALLLLAPVVGVRAALGLVLLFAGTASFHAALIEHSRRDR